MVNYIKFWNVCCLQHSNVYVHNWQKHVAKACFYIKVNWSDILTFNWYKISVLKTELSCDMENLENLKKSGSLITGKISHVRSGNLRKF